MAVEKKKTYEASWNTMLHEQKECLELEVPRHATGLAKDHSFDKRGRYALYTAVMKREALPLGFRFDKTNSNLNYPVFSKEITADWDLCWTIDDVKAFCWSPTQGNFEPHLGLRNRHSRGRLDKARAGEFLFIGYQHIVPGFGNAYWTFHDLEELEAMIKAHLYFYSLMAPIINDGLRRAVEEELRLSGSEWNFS